MNVKKHSNNKSAIYLAAYIVFLFLCIWVHQYRDFAQWKPLVVSITVSSALFEIASLLKNELNYNDHLCKYYDDNLKVIEEKCNDIKTDGMEKIKEEINRQIRKNERRKTECHVYSILSTALTLFGIVFLLCNSVFGSYDEMLNDNLELITILTFAILLSARLFEMLSHEIFETAETVIKELQEEIIKLSDPKSTTEATNNAD